MGMIPSIEAQLDNALGTVENLRKRVAELEAALHLYADAVERVYGDLPAHQYPGPPTSLVANMRNIANNKC